MLDFLIRILRFSITFIIFMIKIGVVFDWSREFRIETLVISSTHKMFESNSAEKYACEKYSTRRIYHWKNMVFEQ